MTWWVVVAGVAVEDVLIAVEAEAEAAADVGVEEVAVVALGWTSGHRRR